MLRALEMIQLRNGGRAVPTLCIWDVPDRAMKGRMAPCACSRTCRPTMLRNRRAVIHATDAQSTDESST